ncbi:hypothetical protein [Streptomyces pini]|uniref:hypothetical protein n=1 Tax=Streptomyces pini TaxID=1520580 RepID=UPI000B85DB4B|nr:hypothetical protein [Streptomyces pini]
MWLGGEGATAVLDSLEKRLRTTDGRQVPHARADTGEPSGADGVRVLLDRVHELLSVRSFGAGHLGFRHYEVLRCLLGPWNGEGGGGGGRAEAAARLRSRRTPVQEGQAVDQGGLVGQIGAVWQLVWWLLRQGIPAALFQLAVSGRFPGIGRPYRWFMRQEYLVPRSSGGFLAFAGWILALERNGERREEIDKLLVHAFLQDLRRAYPRLSWRVRCWRRTVYPVVLVKGAGPGDAGERLLRLVGEVRCETGWWDPLLAVYARRRQPWNTGAPETSALVPVRPEEVGKGGGTARERGPGPGRPAADDTAWLLPVEISGMPAQDGGEDGGGPPVIAPGAPRWYTHRTFAAALCLALLVPLLGWSRQWLGGPDCLHRPFSGQVSVRSAGGECVGYSDSDAFRFNDEPGQEKLQRVQEKIFEQNRRARRGWEKSDRRRPYVTVVYLGTLTGRNTNDDEEAYAAERQELEGLAVAQYRGIKQPASAADVPLMHVVVANAGFQMRHAAPVIDMIADLARGGGEAPVIGVVGLVESRKSTFRALKRLNQEGIPAIAPTLSGEGMYQGSSLYLQIATPNRDQATMVAEYARSRGIRKARVYYTVGERSSREDDIYVSTLVEEVRKKVEGVEYVEDFMAKGLRREECGYPGMLFFAGRWSEFHDFLRGLATCEEQPRLLVADDSVNRYMANPSLRRSAPAGLPLVFASKAPLATCEALRSRAREGRDGRAAKFLQLVSTTLGDRPLETPRCTGPEGEAPEEPVGERVGLAHDSALLLLEAVESLTERVRVPGETWDPRLVGPVTVHTEVLRLNGERPFSGATGQIRFHRGGGEPMGRTISFLKVGDITDLDEPPREVFRCEGTGADGEIDCAALAAGTGGSQR